MIQGNGLNQTCKRIVPVPEKTNKTARYVSIKTIQGTITYPDRVTGPLPGKTTERKRRTPSALNTRSPFLFSVENRETKQCRFSPPGAGVGKSSFFPKERFPFSVPGSRTPLHEIPHTHLLFMITPPQGGYTLYILLNRPAGPLLHLKLIKS